MRKWIIVLTVLCSVITTAGCSKAAKQPSPIEWTSSGAG